MRYNRLNPIHWLVALCSNSREASYITPKMVAKVGPREYGATTRLLWWWRNPAADFGYYIIGFMDDPEFSTAWLQGDDTLATPGWTLALRKWHRLRLPFVSYVGEWNGYFGWHANGRFGIRLRRKSA